ncbi:hypothetical protein [Burkholderia vietnamiensis]|uniref:hypothetical protein n=1 Tax=Burkholderia vietnamiensis TaxID=60552 RepID=UPI0020114F62|nr:hypothetical protein [Burkholderia vietnamiensis]
MKRWLMILLFAAGGVATEVAHPVQCSLLSVSRQRSGTRRARDDGGSVWACRPVPRRCIAMRR